MTTNSQLETAILNTLSYFSIFEHPLTSLEIQRLLLNPKGTKTTSNLFRIRQVLKKSRNIETNKGFYCLSGQLAIISKRQAKQLDNHRKIKIAQKFLSKQISGAQWVAAVNNLAYNNASQQSDIDLLVQTNPHQMWTTRFHLLFKAKFLNQRARAKSSPGENRNKLDFNFFIKQSATNFKQYQLDKPDYYFIYWLAQIIPIWGQISFFEEFNQKIKFIKYYLPNWYPYQPSSQRYQIPKQAKNNFNLESFYRWLQLKIMPPQLKKMAANNQTKVVINQQILKFHSNDRRSTYNAEFRKKQLPDSPHA